MKNYIVAIVGLIALVFGGYWAVNYVVDEMVASRNGGQPRQLRLVPCSLVTSRKVRVDYLGFDAKGEYKIGLRLAWDEVPKQILEMRSEQLGVLGQGGISGHQVYYAVPVNAAGNPLIKPPPSLYESGTEEQKNLYTSYPSHEANPDAYAEYYTKMFKKDYSLQGYEYQFVDENGVHYRSPYFNIVSWNEGNIYENNSANPTNIYRFEPDFEDLHEVITNDDVWHIPDGDECN